MTRVDGFEIKDIEEALLAVGFGGFRFTRASGGVSTEVYRMDKENEVYYLRIAEKEKTFWPEVEAHRLCRKKGVLVPEVVFYEENNLKLKRDIMITTVIEGEELKNQEEIPNETLKEAGRNLALINSIPIEGMGWIDNDFGVKQIRGDGVNYGDFILENIDGKVERLVNFNIFNMELANKVKEYIKQKSRVLLEYKKGYLAHGDFDISHIFALNGKFSGIIDFGDIRSTSIYHDLAHFYTYSRQHFPKLVQGYREVTKLDSDFEERIRIEAMVMAVGKLNWVAKNNIYKFSPEKADYKMIKEIVGLDEY